MGRRRAARGNLAAPDRYAPGMTPKQARTARWIMVVVLFLAAVTVIALGQSMWWVALFFALLIVLSFVFGRYEAGPEGDPPGPT